MKNKQTKLNGIKAKIGFGCLLGGLGITSAVMFQQTFSSSPRAGLISAIQIAEAVEAHEEYMGPPRESLPQGVRMPVVLAQVPAFINFDTSETVMASSSKEEVAPDLNVAPISEEGVVAGRADIAPSSETIIIASSPLLSLATNDRDSDFSAKAEIQLDEGDLNGAFRSLRRHLYVKPPTSSILYQLATIGRQISEYALSEQALLDAGALDPENSEIHVEMARLHIATRSYRSARMAARQAIRLDNDNAMAWNVAGRVAMLQYHFQRAEQAFRRSLAISPTHPMVYNNLGLLYVRMGDGEEAVDSLEAAVELFDDATPYFVFNNLGLAYEKTGAFEDARDAFEQAIAVNPKYTRARLNLERAVITLAEQALKKASKKRLASLAVVSPTSASVVVVDSAE